MRIASKKIPCMTYAKRVKTFMVWPEKLNIQQPFDTFHTKRCYCNAGLQMPTGEESVIHEHLTNALPDKEAVKKLISDSSDLSARLQKPKAKKSRASASADSKPASSGKAEASSKAKTVILEEAAEFEVKPPCQ